MIAITARMTTLTDFNHSTLCSGQTLIDGTVHIVVNRMYCKLAAPGDIQQNLTPFIFATARTINITEDNLYPFGGNAQTTKAPFDTLVCVIQQSFGKTKTLGCNRKSAIQDICHSGHP